ncbi:Protein of unknown function [Bacillus mobilis]|nr:Protein of unknown function [Bacillus mobilis]
MFEDDVTDER